jgi:hypothetical protein
LSLYDLDGAPSDASVGDMGTSVLDIVWQRRY